MLPEHQDAPPSGHSGMDRIGADDGCPSVGLAGFASLRTRYDGVKPWNRRRISELPL